MAARAADRISAIGRVYCTVVLNAQTAHTQTHTYSNSGLYRLYVRHCAALGRKYKDSGLYDVEVLDDTLHHCSVCSVCGS